MLMEKWICFLFPLKKKVQTLCYWNEKRDVPNVGKSSGICAGSEMTQAEEIFDLTLVWLSLHYELTNTKLYKLRTR